MRKKILFIDDEEDFCHFAKLNLEKTEKFEVLIATKPRMGIVLAKSIQPDLIFLDILMPEMAGSEVAARLLEDEPTSKIPIVFLTAMVNKEEVGSKGSKIGGRDFLAKPVTPEELVAKIESILGEQ